MLKELLRNKLRKGDIVEDTEKDGKSEGQEEERERVRNGMWMQFTEVYQKQDLY